MSFLGIIIGIGAIITANLIEGGNPLALIDIPAVFIVLGSATGAIVVQFPFKVIIQALKDIKWLFAPPSYDLQSQLDFIDQMASTARQQGLLALENSLAGVKDNFTRDGLQMIVDGTDKDQLITLLDKQIEEMEYRDDQPAKVWEAMGGYAPCFGIVGAVLGLIHAMGLLDQPDLLGPAIGVAFVATIYGVVSANLIFFPMANRFRTINRGKMEFILMTMDGLVSIATGENSMQIKRKLSAYLPEGSQGVADGTA